MRSGDKKCLVRLESPQVAGNRVRLEGRLDVPGAACPPVFFEFTCPDPGRVRPSVRPFLLAFLLPAMRVGMPLVLEQPVDAVTLGNLLEWQAGFAAWRPKRLRIVPLLAPPGGEPEGSEPIARGALTAFSGGVDSCFTVHQETRSARRDIHRRIPLGAGLMVHGFDIPLDQGEVFESACANSTALLQSFDLPTYRLRTNLRSLERVFRLEWGPEAHGVWLGAALACLEPWFDGLVIPSTYSYAHMKFPWGSNPISDPLLGSARVPCWHEGAGHNKLTKVQAIAADPTVVARVRVCWEGDRLDRNCGHCFKCIATQVCFWLAGVERPTAFPSPCTLAEVTALPVKDEQNRFLVALLEAEAKNQRRMDLAAALAHAKDHPGHPTRRRSVTSILHRFSNRFFP